MRDLSARPGRSGGGSAGVRAGEPLGGDWGSGERVFGPPHGTVESDWLVPLVREAHPALAHEAARDAVARVWAVLRDEAERAGVPSAEADDAAVRRRLGLPATPGEVVAGDGTGGDGPEGDGEPVLLTALRVVRAAARAYGG